MFSYLVLRLCIYVMFASTHKFVNTLYIYGWINWIWKNRLLSKCACTCSSICPSDINYHIPVRMYLSSKAFNSSNDATQRKICVQKLERRGVRVRVNPLAVEQIGTLVTMENVRGHWKATVNGAVNGVWLGDLRMAILRMANGGGGGGLTARRTLNSEVWIAKMNRKRRGEWRTAQRMTRRMANGAANGVVNIE